jgi:hypothetical protein
MIDFTIEPFSTRFADQLSTDFGVEFKIAFLYGLRTEVLEAVKTLHSQSGGNLIVEMEFKNEPKNTDFLIFFKRSDGRDGRCRRVRVFQHGVNYQSVKMQLDNSLKSDQYI